MVPVKDFPLDANGTGRRGRKRKLCTAEPTTDHSSDQDMVTDRTVRSPPPGMDLETFKRLCRERRKLASTRPKLFLTQDGMREGKLGVESDGTEAKEEKRLLFMFDLQCLLLNALQGQRSSFKPDWCRLLRVTKVPSVLLIVLEGVSFRDMDRHRDCCPYLWENFAINVEIVAPAQYGSSAIVELFQVPLSAEQMLKEKATRQAVESVKMKKSQVFRERVPSVASPTSSFSRLNLVLSAEQMAYERFPLPSSDHPDIKHFVYSKKKYAPVQASSPMFAVDCEMCVTVGQKTELTRVSIIDEDLNVVYDTLVKPYNRITNYVTKYSGITEKMMRGVTTRLKDVQQFMQKNLPADAILCGQSLGSDLKALQMFHPYVIDTSVIFNLNGQRRRKTGLKALSQFFLGKTIQASSQGHCSVEDAQSTMELVLLKLRGGMEFGDFCVPQLPAASTSSGGSSSEADSADRCQAAHTERVTRKALALQEWRKAHSQSAFPLIESCGKKVCLIDRQEVLEKVVVSGGVTCQAVSSDREAVSLARQHQDHADLVWVGLPEASQSFLQDAGGKAAAAALRSVDRRLRKVVERTREMGLAVVLVTGRAGTADGVENAAAFLRLNCPDLPPVAAVPSRPQDSG